MTHPLSSLFENRPESVAVVRPSGTSLADASAAPEIAAPATPRSPGRPLSGQLIGPGFSVVAFREPADATGLPGEIFFAPGLNQAERKAVADDFAWWDRVDRRKAVSKSGGRYAKEIATETESETLIEE